MTIEELMALTAIELKAKADELGIEYLARAPKKDIAELIYAKTTNQDGAQEMAEADEETGGESGFNLGNGVFIIPGQLIQVQIRQNSGDLVLGELALDEVLSAGESVLDQEMVDLRIENSALRAEKAELETQAYRKAIDHPSQAPEETVIFWNGQDQMTIRARVKPNSGISNRIRGGHEFTLQYQIITVDKRLFDVLSKDQYIQMDAVGNSHE